MLAGYGYTDTSSVINSNSCGKHDNGNMYCTMQQAKLLIGIGKPVNNVVKDIDKNKYRSIKLYIGSFFSHYKAVCIASVAKQKKNIELNDSLIHCQLFCCLFFSTSWSSVCVDISLIIHQKKNLYIFCAVVTSFPT